MTIEQKAKLYDEIVKERDAYAYLLGEFLERMAHLKYNGLHRYFDDKEGKELETFRMSLEELSNLYTKTDDRLAFDLSDIFSVLKSVDAKFDEIKGKGPAEIAAFLPKVIDIKKTYQEAHSWDKEPTSENIEKYKLSPEEIAYQLITFLNEYQFDHKYPGVENNIYHDVLQRIMIGALANLGIVPDQKSIVDFIAKYDEKNKK